MPLPAILWKQISSQWEKTGMRLNNRPYIIINTVFAGVILLIMIYSGIFSPDKNTYPVVCIHEKITGIPCASCGISHSFSLIVRGRIAEAYTWNENGMNVFLFFVSQLVMRIAFSVFYLKNPSLQRQLILMDITGSAMLFLLAFMPFIISIFRNTLSAF
jgi:hypothetical protein